MLPSELQAALIDAKPGDVIELGEGRFDFKSTLSLDIERRDDSRPGARQDDSQLQGPRAGDRRRRDLLITSKNDVALENFAVEDARGDGIKANGTNKIAFRKIRTEWTGGPKETNGGYGIYPVQCKSVVIEDCKVSGASDAGIYVGQSQDIVVRRNKVEKNVAGIEIENSTRADVYENEATDNSGGILVFTMPDLPVKDGRLCRVYNNKVIANNHENFAPKGNIVATVPPGTGVMIMANKEVEVFDNTIEKNQTTGLSVVSYLLPRSRSAIPNTTRSAIRSTSTTIDSRITAASPRRDRRDACKALWAARYQISSTTASSIPKKQVDGKLPEALALKIKDNGKAGFANFDAMGLKAVKEGKAKQPNIVRELKSYEGSRPALSRRLDRGTEVIHREL